MLLILNVKVVFSGDWVLSSLKEGGLWQSGAGGSQRQELSPASHSHPGRSAVCGSSTDSQHSAGHYPEAKDVHL